MNSMERRQYKRIAINLTAEIISQGQTWTGQIENVSEGGLEYLLTSSFKISMDFALKKIIDLHLHLKEGETLKLRCEVRWFLRPSVPNNILTLGLKILDPPPSYREFIDSLLQGSSKRTIGS
jgi:hypothetical protein